MKQSSNKIENNFAILEEIGKIPSTVAVSENVKDFENKKVVFSFEDYNQNQCEIANLDKKDAKKLTTELKKASLVLAKHIRHQQSSGIACKPISNSGNYGALFGALSPDIEILEIDYSGAGRIFGYLVHNIFSVVAINKKHR